jgi:hypothetical protein
MAWLPEEAVKLLSLCEFRIGHVGREFSSTICVLSLEDHPQAAGVAGTA